jgi:hypothetical protein
MQLSASSIIARQRAGASRACSPMSEIIPINPHRHLLANQIRLFGMTNHPPTGYPSSLRFLNKFKTAYPLENSSPTNFRSIRSTRRWPKLLTSTAA